MLYRYRIVPTSSVCHARGKKTHGLPSNSKFDSDFNVPRRATTLHQRMPYPNTRTKILLGPRVSGCPTHTPRAHASDAASFPMMTTNTDGQKDAFGASLALENLGITDSAAESIRVDTCSGQITSECFRRYLGTHEWFMVPHSTRVLARVGFKHTVARC